MGIPEGLGRHSVAIENIADPIADLDQALMAIHCQGCCEILYGRVLSSRFRGQRYVLASFARRQCYIVVEVFRGWPLHCQGLSCWSAD